MKNRSTVIVWEAVIEACSAGRAGITMYIPRRWRIGITSIRKPECCLTVTSKSLLGTSICAKAVAGLIEVKIGLQKIGT